MKYFTAAFLLIMIALCAVLFFLPDKIRKAAQTSEEASVREVVVTTYPIWLLTRELMDGTGRTPQLLTPPDAGCPHDYTLTTTDLLKISGKPILLFANGAGLDDHLCQAALSANKDIDVVDTSEEIERILTEGDDDVDHEAEHDHHDGDDDHEGDHEGHHHHHHGGKNGHFFASPFQAFAIIDTIYSALVQNDPLNVEIYEKNVTMLEQMLRLLQIEYQSNLSPYTGTRVAAQHDIFDYLLLDIGFEKPISIFADPETPPSPAEITKLTQEFKEQGVKVIFTEPQYPDDLAKLIGKETGATVVKIDSLASGPANPPPLYYYNVMRNNISLMKKALAE